jgi:protein TonB
MIISLALHGALVLPFVVPSAEPPEDPSVLVVELMGIRAPIQSEEKIQQQTKGEEASQQAQTATPPTPPDTQPERPAPEEPREDASENGTREQAPPEQPVEQQREAAQQQPPSLPAPASISNPGLADIEGVTEQQKAQAITKEDVDEKELLRAYLKVLTKKVQENLVYPDAGRLQGLKGTASVAFTVQADGAVAPGTLRIATSSGQPKLDAAAMKTVEASAPFAVPPRSITIAISVVYGKVTRGGKNK